MGIVSESIRESSRVGTAWGFAVMIAGMLAIMAPFITGITTTMLLAIIVTGAGLMTITYSVKAGSFGKGVLQFLFGGITVVAGILMFMTPGLTMLTLTGVLLVYFLVDGIFVIVSGFQAKPAEGWVWLVVSGIASVVLAYLLWQEWPVSGQYAVGILVGIRLIFTGWSIAMLGVVGDSVSDEIEQNTQ
jgi:uncharacterized membrane protein HdeD (DUF308 family)